ncbi:MAG: hypothetical protein ABJH72_03970 [Reichenbachiella sp.]|uniref:hypothetical protein n=1 Tax=Reichenbachiella sp. TaxID=2184521 RepID=UPI003298723D
MMKLVANIESFDNHFVAYVESIKGLVVEGSSLNEVCKELLTSLKVKMSYDYGIDISSIAHKEFPSEKKMKEFVDQLNFKSGEAQKEINLDMSFC